LDIVHAGYVADFDELTPASQSDPVSSSRVRATRLRSPNETLLIDRVRRVARLAPGLAFDSGGIGKGLGADIVTRELRASGAAGAMVSLGGDVRVRGAWPDDGWRIGVHNPVNEEEITIKLRDGAICTSSIVKRRWRNPDGSVAHHLLDPKTRRSSSAADIVGASVIARHGWRAEVMTKVAILGSLGELTRLVQRNGEMAALRWDADGGHSQIA